MPDKPKGNDKKILGMPRTTGIIVIGLGALVVGYFVISRMGGSKGSTGTGTGSSGGGSGRPGFASGSNIIVRIIKEQGGHKRKKQGK